MANIGVTYPGSGSSTSETGHSGYTWNTPGNIVNDDTSYATITTNSFDAGATSYILRGYNFNFAALPDTATIDGIIVTIRAWYVDAGVNIDLVQLLDATGAKVGDNKAATPTALTSSEATYTFGAADSLWGNLLTAAWVKDADFGVAIGAISTGTNSEVYVDWVKMDVYYHVNVIVAAGLISGVGDMPTATPDIDNPVSVTPEPAILTLTGESVEPTIDIQNAASVTPEPAVIVATGTPSDPAIDIQNAESVQVEPDVIAGDYATLAHETKAGAVYSPAIVDASLELLIQSESGAAVVEPAIITGNLTAADNVSVSVWAWTSVAELEATFDLPESVQSGQAGIAADSIAAAFSQVEPGVEAGGSPVLPVGSYCNVRLRAVWP